MLSPLFADKPQNLPFSGHGRSRSATRPISPKTAFSGRRGVLASTAVVVGDVRIGDHSSVVSRGFKGGYQLHRVGAHTNIQMVPSCIWPMSTPAKSGIGSPSATAPWCTPANRQRMSDWHELYRFGWRRNRAQSVVGANALVTRHTDSPAHWFWVALPSCAPLTEAERPTSAVGPKVRGQRRLLPETQS